MFLKNVVLYEIYSKKAVTEYFVYISVYIVNMCVHISFSL